MELDIFPLENGLKVILVERKVGFFLIKLFIKSGSVYERRKNSGVAHLLEHVLTSENLNSPSETFLNAYTTEEYTAHFVTLPTGYEEDAIMVLHDSIRREKITREKLEREKRVIEREKNASELELEDMLLTSLRRNLYQTHPLKYPVEGEKKLVKDLKTSDLLEHYENYYLPSNSVLVIAGEFNRAKMVQLIEKFFSPWKGGKRKEKMEFKEPKFSRGIEEITNFNRNKISYCILGFKTVPYNDPTAPYFEVFSYLLTEGKNAILRKEIIQRETIFLESWTTFYFTGPGYIAIYFASPKEREEEIMKRILESVYSSPIKEEAIEKAKRFYLVEEEMDKMTTEAIAERVGPDFLYLADPFYSYNFTKKVLEADPTSISRVVEEYIVPDNLTTVILR